MNLVTLAIRNLRRRVLRSAIVAFSVGLAVASALSLVALSASIESSSHESVDERGADLTVMQRDAPDFFSGFIPEATASAISCRRIPPICLEHCLWEMSHFSGLVMALSRSPR